jgi:PBP1b-binding outer membrane lipoprotein LpoB
MKTYIALILAAVFLSACGNNQPGSTTNPQPAAGSQSAPANTGSQAAAPQTTTGAPVEFIYGGITSDKANISYKIKVNTTRPIDEVHLALKEMDSQGKAVENTTVVWQNIVGSTRRPIENGKSYEDQTALDPAAVKAECSLKEVIFKDGTRWSPK